MAARLFFIRIPPNPCLAGDLALRHIAIDGESPCLDQSLQVIFPRQLPALQVRLMVVVIMRENLHRWRSIGI